MQTVPSLVGTGTVVAAATAGLLFGQPSDSSSQRPPSHKRKLTPEFESLGAIPPPSSRPGTSSAVVEDDSALPSPQLPLQPLSSTSTNTARLPRAVAAQSTPPKASARRHSFIRQVGDWAPPPISEVSRDSVSSNGSWMRRLSIRPLSQHGSPRSSVLLDSPSVTFSHGSGAPILSPAAAAAPQQQQQQPRNKLVKRTTTGQDSGPGTLSRRGSRSQMPTLRRPATSHQRSATLQQQFQYPPSAAAAAGAPVPKYSLDQQLRPSLPRPQLDPTTPETAAPEQQATAVVVVAKWTSFFHSRLARSAGRGTSARSSENSPSNHQPLPNRRIHLRQGSLPRAYLITPAMIADQPLPPPLPSAAIPRDADGDAAHLESSPVHDSSNPSPEETPSKRARRSISMHFSSPTNWIPRTGSLRRPKRGSSENKVMVVGGEGGGGGRVGKRHVSAPVGASQTTAAAAAAQPDLRRAVQDIFAPPDHRQEAGPHAPVGVESHHLTRQRNSSSPLPPLSRLSSFNVDLSRLGASAAPAQKHHSAQASSSYSFPAHSRDVSNERASTGSDLEMRGFASGDDDDTDFKSDTMFDSLRTVGSARLRTVETPLESMFDESPPSTAGNSKTKRLSIQEILGRSWDGDTNIMEEDEGIPTPIRGAQSAHANADFNPHEADFPSHLAHLASDMANHHQQQPPPPPPAESPLGNRDFGRLSLDADDDDDDWARIDENGVTNHLSPPSSLINSRGVSPNLRRALASISGNSSPEGTYHDAAPSERPRSNVFDWSEPPLPHEKLEADGQSPRPKTVHGKQELDIRGGRTANRKGRVGLHARSHSVPVIADPVESTKSTSKFGTWASGPKNTSEDWDDDFDFDAGAGGSSALGKGTPAMVVPASIQATQPTVKAHSGQIRELSHLVNGLKRLCRHARELDIVDQSPDLWKEAENIIALASPDEEEEEEEEEEADEDVEDRPAMDFDASSVDERYLDEGFDAGTMHSFDDPFEVPETEMSRTAVVRERQVTQRRSVFSDADNIFGNSSSSSSSVVAETSRPQQQQQQQRPRTPERQRDVDTPDSAMISSIMEAMQQQRSASAPIRGSPVKPSKSELFFNTNTLQELVKRANSLFHTLSDMVRRADYLPQSPAGTPRRERHQRADGSPAFTRVFTDPSSPSKRLPKSHGTNSPLGKKASMEASASSSGGGMGQQQRMHMMTVN